MNDKFDLSEWSPRFKDEDFFPTTGTTIYIPRMVGPHDICGVDWVRDQLADELEFGSAIPVDYFIWAEGEGERIGSTRFGGRPDLRSPKDWPTGREGKHLPFLAQINFGDSRDLVSVPDDLLSIFAHIENGCVEEYRLVWSNSENVQRMEADWMPETAYSINPYHGHICRFPTFAKMRPKRVFSRGEKYRLRSGQVHILGDYCQPEGSCIGGSDYQYGKFILRLCNLVPTPKVRYPYVNRSDAYSDFDKWKEEFITQRYMATEVNGVEWPSPHFSFADCGSLRLVTGKKKSGNFVLTTSSY